MLSWPYFQYFLQPGGDPLILCFVDFSTASQAAVALEALQGEMNIINIVSIYRGFVVLPCCRSFSASVFYTFYCIYTSITYIHLNIFIWCLISDTQMLTVFLLLPGNIPHFQFHDILCVWSLLTQLYFSIYYLYSFLLLTLHIEQLTMNWEIHVGLVNEWASLWAAQARLNYLINLLTRVCFFCSIFIMRRAQACLEVALVDSYYQSAFVIYNLYLLSVTT